MNSRRARSRQESGCRSADTTHEVVSGTGDGTRVFLRNAALALTLSSLFGCSSGVGAAAIVQPMGFSHAKHFEEDASCLDCHIRSEEGQYATLPSLKACMLCHEEPQGESPEEPKVREYAERDEPIPWVRVNRVEGHVYFSHAPHIVLGGMECAECHGDMTTVDEPVTSSQIEGLTMKKCMDCHEERGVSNDCLLCHQ